MKLEKNRKKLQVVINGRMKLFLVIYQVIKLFTAFVCLYKHKTIQILERNNPTNHTNNTPIRHDQQDKHIRAPTNYFKPWTIT